MVDYKGFSHQIRSLQIKRGPQRMVLCSPLYTCYKFLMRGLPSEARWYGARGEAF